MEEPRRDQTEESKGRFKSRRKERNHGLAAGGLGLYEGQDTVEWLGEG
jgi:hypothetical protein